MAYQADKPQATDKKAKSQQDILDNFTELNTFLSKNHKNLNDINQGKHIKVDLMKLAADPTTGADEMCLFNKDNKLQLRPQNDGDIYDFMNISGLTAEGFHLFPNGMLIKWGEATANGATAHNFPVAATIPVFSSVYKVIISTKATGGGYDNVSYFINATNTTINVYGSARTVNRANNSAYTYLAIGKK